MTWGISHLLLEFGKCKDWCIIPARGGQRLRLRQELAGWQWKEDTPGISWDGICCASPIMVGQRCVCFPELDLVIRSQSGIFYKVYLPRRPHRGAKGVLQRNLWGGLLEAQRLGAGRGSSKQLDGAVVTSREQWSEVLRGRIPGNR